MESKKLKLKVHHRNFSAEDLIVNCEALSREKLEVREGDLLEIFPPDDRPTTWRSHLILKVKLLPPDIQSKGGPFSVLQEVAVAFSLTGLREVRVRRVDQTEVALDLVELSFKDQLITRSDMWRITCFLLSRCLYSGQHLEQCSMRLQTHCLWYQGERVTSGAVSSATRVVFRSLSAHVFLFIQISSEMWDFDPNGEFFFDKAVSGFLRELFVRWREAGCNHDVTIIFFWRLHYDHSLSKSLSGSSSVREDKKRGLLYEDFFRVIVESTSNSDWSSELINIKKSFLKLKPLIDNLRGQTNAELCKSEEGNILEAINLALNIMERHNLDTNLQLSGQQIVVLTAGTGYFEIDRKLMQVTNERLVYGGVTTDLVSMRDQPLHAMPMFKFHSKDEEFFSVPHWINYSFYSSSKGCGQQGFQPRIYLSDHLVNTYLQKDASEEAEARLYRPISVASSAMADHQLRTWVDTDRHDAAIFELPNARSRTKVRSVGRMTESGGRGGGEGSQEASGGSTNGRPSVTFHMGETDPFDGIYDSGSPSPESYPTETDPSPRQFTRSLVPPRQRYKSENFGDGTAVDRLGSSTGTRRDRSNFASVGSAEALRQGSTPWDTFRDSGGGADCHPQPKKFLSFSNPFDPNRIHSEAPAFQRRWVHVFPTNKRGVAFQTHHEETERRSQVSDADPSRKMPIGSAASTPQTSARRRGILKHSLATSPGETDGSRSGSFRGERSQGGSMKRTSGTPVSGSSPRDGEHRRGNRDKGLLSTNVSSVTKPDNSGSDFGSRVHTPSSSRQASATNTPESFRRQRFAEPPILSSTTENFASVRRTGVDWTSLVKPAHLPVTTDFYPAKEILDRDYVQYNSSLVVFGEEGASAGESSGYSEKKAPVWHSDHSTMSTLQAFQEMISQRLSQGFQLTCPPPSERSLHPASLQAMLSRDLNTVFVLREALEQLQRPVKGGKGGLRHRPSDSVTVHMGLSHVFQKLVLAFQDISIFIYRQKSPLESQPWLYSYQLSSAPEGGAFQTVSAHFSVTSDDYNWNYLDNHICGYSDFEELGESLRYWEVRYLLLPKTCPSLPPLCGDSDLARQERETLISNFVCFLEFLNHLRKSGAAGPRRTSSAQSLLDGARQATQNRHSSLPAKPTTSQRARQQQPRSSLPTTLDHTPSSAISSLSPSPTPTPTPSHTATPSRSRQLSEIEEEEEKKMGVSTSSPAQPVSRSRAKRGSDGRLEAERERGSRREREGGGGKKMTRASQRRQSAADVDSAGVKKARSRENLLQAEQPMSRSAHESPSRRESSRSPSHTPLHGENKRDSPRTERKKIISKLKKITMEDPAQNSDGELGERSQFVEASSSAGGQGERESELESSLDYHAQLSAAVAAVKSGLVEEESSSVNIDSPLVAILAAMESETDGVDFLGTGAGLCKGCFVAMDAVKWIMENVRGVATRRQAAKILQSMIAEQMVIHASGDPTVPFLDGYFFYCISHREEPPKDALNSSYYIVNNDIDSFSRKWFETEIVFPSSSLMGPADEVPPSPSSLASSFKTGQPYYMGYDQAEEAYVPPSIVNRRAELNPDPHLHSSRPEWCYVHYDRIYDPCQAFQLRFQWMVTTTNLLSSLIQSWVRNASMCDFNLVAVPVHRSLRQDSSQSSAHPFRRPSFILLSLPSDIKDRWRAEEGEVSLAERTRTLLMAVASRNGFLPDCPPPTPDTSILSPHYAEPSEQNSPSFLVHHTGTALIQLALPGEPRDHAQPHVASPIPSIHSRFSARRGLHSQLLHPQGSTSTPLERSPVKLQEPTSDGGSVSSSGGASTSENRETTLRQVACDAEGKTGFYWHKNCLLPKQKNVPPGLVGRYDQVMEKLTSDCGNRDQILDSLCERLFS